MAEDEEPLLGHASTKGKTSGRRAGRLLTFSGLLLIGAALVLFRKSDGITDRNRYCIRCGHADTFEAEVPPLVPPPHPPPSPMDAVTCNVLDPWVATVQQFAQLSRQWHSPARELCDYNGSPCDAFGPNLRVVLSRLAWPTLEHMGTTEEANLILRNTTITLRQFPPLGEAGAFDPQLVTSTPGAIASLASPPTLDSAA